MAGCQRKPEMYCEYLVFGTAWPDVALTSLLMKIRDWALGCITRPGAVSYVSVFWVGIVDAGVFHG
jgi:hypothetical protein